MRAEELMEIEIKNRVNDQQLTNQYDKTNLFYFHFGPYQMHSINASFVSQLRISPIDWIQLLYNSIKLTKQRYRDKSSRVQRDEVFFLPQKTSKGLLLSYVFKR
jgi:hypothetical protein